MDKVKVGVSSCLLGENVRYDAGYKHDRFITETLGAYFEWVPVCPEVEYGLPVPREAMHLVGDPASPRLVTVKTGIDHTDGMRRWSEKKLKKLQKEDLCGFIFKGSSSSSGIYGIKVYTSDGMPGGKSEGIFGGAFKRSFPLIPIIDDVRLHDPDLRENFIEKVFVYKRWKDFLKNPKKIGEFISFHTDLKLLIMAHSPKHYASLGKLVANAKKYNQDELYPEYIHLLMKGLGLIATVKKNTNVLMHITGYFKKKITVDEKQELLELIDQYHSGYIPLIVPLVLIQHYVRKYREPYLARQFYLNPHPVEMMLRNHA